MIGRSGRLKRLVTLALALDLAIAATVVVRLTAARDDPGRPGVHLLKRPPESERDHFCLDDDYESPPWVGAGEGSIYPDVQAAGDALWRWGEEHPDAFAGVIYRPDAAYVGLVKHRRENLEHLVSTSPHPKRVKGWVAQYSYADMEMAVDRITKMRLPSVTEIATNIPCNWVLVEAFYPTQAEVQQVYDAVGDVAVFVPYAPPARLLPRRWKSASASSDGMTLTVVAWSDDCGGTWDHLEVRERADSVEIRPMWKFAGLSLVCPAMCDPTVVTSTVQLSRPLGDRRLVQPRGAPRVCAEMSYR